MTPRTIPPQFAGLVKLDMGRQSGFLTTLRKGGVLQAAEKLVSAVILSEALEWGSLLPLSSPRARSRGLQPRASLPASKLARAKAAVRRGRTPLQSGLRPRRLAWRSAPALTSFSAACLTPPQCGSRPFLHLAPGAARENKLRRARDERTFTSVSDGGVKTLPFPIRGEKSALAGSYCREQGQVLL
jgi:hypothetical protein